jgi:hypothetical protein
VDHAAAIEALEQSLEAVRAEAPLVLAAFTLVDRPAKLVYVRKADGTLETTFKADVRILGADGKALFEQADFGSWTSHPAAGCRTCS